MACPHCKTGSMQAVGSKKSGIEQCVICETVWFDSGEIRELTEGRFPEKDEPEKNIEDKKKTFNRMSRAWGEAAYLFCRGCSRQLVAIDFQNTGIPVFYCRDCGGILASRDTIAELVDKFRFQRGNADMYDALGRSLAADVRQRFDKEYPGSDNSVDMDKGVSFLASCVPVVVPLKDANKPDLYPVVTLGFLAIMVAAYLLCFFEIGGIEKYQARIALPSGVGIVSAPSFLILAPFFHGGIFPLVINGLFLYVLGDNVEDRMGRFLFFFFYLTCGIVAGVAHIILGKTGASAAMGAAGAVGGVLGAYIVFFPEMQVTVYRAGEISSLPAYFLACLWVIAQFILGWFPLPEVLSPAPYSFAGNLGGFAAGAFIAVLMKSLHSTHLPPPRIPYKSA